MTIERLIYGIAANCGMEDVLLEDLAHGKAVQALYQPEDDKEIEDISDVEPKLGINFLDAVFLNFDDSLKRSLIDSEFYIDFEVRR